MKITSSVSPDTGRTDLTPRTPRRAKVAPAGGEAARRAAPSGDRLELSAQATSLRTAEEAARLAGETSELIAQNNREALVSQPVDVRRLASLVGSA